MLARTLMCVVLVRGEEISNVRLVQLGALAMSM
jgi:hypothetical protein